MVWNKNSSQNGNKAITQEQNDQIKSEQFCIN